MRLSALLVRSLPELTVDAADRLPSPMDSLDLSDSLMAAFAEVVGFSGEPQVTHGLAHILTRAEKNSMSRAAVLVLPLMPRITTGGVVTFLTWVKAALSRQSPRIFPGRAANAKRAAVIGPRLVLHFRIIPEATRRSGSKGGPPLFRNSFTVRAAPAARGRGGYALFV